MKFLMRRGTRGGLNIESRGGGAVSDCGGSQCSAAQEAGVGLLFRRF